MKAPLEHTKSSIRRGWAVFRREQITPAPLRSKPSAGQDESTAAPESVPSAANAPWLLGVSSVFFSFRGTPRKPRWSKQLPPPPPPLPAGSPIPAARPGHEALFLQLLQKRVLKFKPRGADLSSLLFGEEQSVFSSHPLLQGREVQTSARDVG